MISESEAVQLRELIAKLERQLEVLKTEVEILKQGGNL